MNTEIFTIKKYKDINEVVDASAINLSWFRTRSGKSNFGDEINPYLVSFLSGRSVKRVPMQETDLIGVGSILHRATERARPYKVWGTGTLTPENFNQNIFDIRCLRGPLTKSLLSVSDSVVFGDPGIIASEVWPAVEKKKYKWGIIPHMTQEKSSWVKKLLDNTPDSILISTGERNISSLMKKISSCEAIASTSLHGLIVADSYYIPNVWLWEKNVNKGGQWKFFDYFAGAGRTYVDNYDPRGIDDLNKISFKRGEFNYFDKIPDVKNNVISAFPL